jgi:hypothetical protein
MTGKNMAFRRSIINAAALIAFGIFSNRLFATLWILILPVGFFVVLFFIVVLIKNIQFWIRNNSVAVAPWLPFLIQCFAILVFCLIPSHNRSKQYHLVTVKLSNIPKTNCPCNLYLEHYSVFQQGAFGTGLNSEYLTDSLNFRKYLGTYDEGRMPIRVSCQGDAIETETSNNDLPVTREVYSLKDLEGERVFE